MYFSIFAYVQKKRIVDCHVRPYLFSTYSETFWTEFGEMVTFDPQF